MERTVAQADAHLRSHRKGVGQPSFFPAYHARQGSALRASTTAGRVVTRPAFA